STLVFEGDGRLGDYAGGYTDWMQDKAKQAARASAVAGVADSGRISNKAPGSATPATTKPSRKLTNKERQELETLPAKIEALEKEQALLTEKLADPSFYRSQAAKFAEVKARLETVEREHAAAFARWEELAAGKA
ncbi:MAG: transport system ATP-binding/permease protein, partial [Verrucomicrobiota bacterium]|nr:transport system ATP-binding/permease protein [Verrucomicrobiota bacterium]